MRYVFVARVFMLPRDADKRNSPMAPDRERAIPAGVIHTHRTVIHRRPAAVDGGPSAICARPSVVHGGAPCTQDGPPCIRAEQPVVEDGRSVMDAMPSGAPADNAGAIRAARSRGSGCAVWHDCAEPERSSGAVVRVGLVARGAPVDRAGVRPPSVRGPQGER